MYYVYILQSEKDNKLYTGYTSNLKQRIKMHFSSEVESTKTRLPLKLIYYEAYTEKEDAQGREKFLKSGSGKRFIRKQLSHYFARNSQVVSSTQVH